MSSQWRNIGRSRSPSTQSHEPLIGKGQEQRRAKTPQGAASETAGNPKQSVLKTREELDEGGRWPARSEATDA